MTNDTSEELPLPFLNSTSGLPASLDKNAQDPISDQVFSSLYNSDLYSDLVIKCQDRVWKTHRAVICVQSQVLAAAINGSFQEAVTGQIDLSDDDPEIVDHMISYLYRGYYDFEDSASSVNAPPPSSPQDKLKSWLWPLQALNPKITSHDSASAFSDLTPVYLTPFEQFNLTSLTDLSRSQTLNIKGSSRCPCPSRLLTHAHVYCLAEQYHIPRLKNYALCRYATLATTAWKSPFFIPSIKNIYDGTPTYINRLDDLRAVATRAAAEHSQYMLDRVEFLEICTENGEIAVDVLRASMELRKMQIDVNWAPKKACKVDKRHALVYIPAPVGFGMSNPGSMLGFGNRNSGRYQCASCHTFVS